MIKTYRVFGYGSLLNENSLKKTVPNASNIKPVILRGFIRVFNAKCGRICNCKNTNVAALNIEKSEINDFINGIVFEMDELHFDELLKREEGYELIEIDIESYEGERFRAVTFRYPHFEAEYDFLFDSEVQMSYYNLCLDGAKSFGDDFYRDFLETTFIGKKKLVKF